MLYCWSWIKSDHHVASHPCSCIFQALLRTLVFSLNGKLRIILRGFSSLVTGGWTLSVKMSLKSFNNRLTFRIDWGKSKARPIDELFVKQSLMHVNLLQNRTAMSYKVHIGKRHSPIPMLAIFTAEILESWCFCFWIFLKSLLSHFQCKFGNQKGVTKYRSCM